MEFVWLGEGEGRNVDRSGQVGEGVPAALEGGFSQAPGTGG